jgi:OmpR-family two-component system manganese-sensing response regulator
MRILLVDDEVEMAAPLSRVLQREGYQVDVAYDGESGWQMAQQHSYDLLILDWMLPHQTGLEICRRVRSLHRGTPVLFLTAKDTVDDRVQGLDAGADDYLIKPFELRELLARVRALLRRPSTLEVSAATLQNAGLELDETNQCAYRNGRRVELSEKETQLLHYLMDHPNQILSHEQIYQYLWGKEANPPTSNALAAQIRLLRRKIEAPGESALIHTIYGKGYRFGSD